MTKLVELPASLPAEITETQERARWCCAQLEEGNILSFPNPPFEIPEEDTQFLLKQQQSSARHHKNIAYRPSEDLLTGYASGGRAQAAQLRAAMRDYSQRATRFASKLLAPYAARWRVGFASFRPQQEKGRQIRLRARNDLLHIDSFPTRPSNGDRILRIFTNLNPTESRVWITSETFEPLAQRFAGHDGLPLPKGFTTPRRVLLKLARAVGFGSLARSPYDHWMLSFHHFLKGNEDFQSGAPRARWEFPPHSTWLVFTDAVSHAVLSGQFALEQTLIISRHSMVAPEKAPVRVLERLAGCALTLD
jgi:hypothetical protein